MPLNLSGSQNVVKYMYKIHSLYQQSQWNKWAFCSVISGAYTKEVHEIATKDLNFSELIPLVPFNQ